jgi:uncharacterized membrane protein
MFIAPISLEPGTVSDLDGTANIVDYEHKWDKLPSYHKAVYYFGDLNCHQKWYRSFTINDNQLPVDARMTSIFIFANVGLLMVMFTRSSMDLADIIFNIFPQRVRNSVIKYMSPSIFIVIIIALALLPVAIDGYTQLLTSYESTNLKRVLTGISAGWIGGIIFGAMMLALSEMFTFNKKEK